MILPELTQRVNYLLQTVYRRRTKNKEQRTNINRTGLFFVFCSLFSDEVHGSPDAFEDIQRLFEIRARVCGRDNRADAAFVARDGRESYALSEDAGVVGVCEVPVLKPDRKGTRLNSSH